MNELQGSGKSRDMTMNLPQAPTSGRTAIPSKDLSIFCGCSGKVPAVEMAAAIVLAWERVYPERSGGSPAERPGDCAILHFECVS